MATLLCALLLLQLNPAPNGIATGVVLSTTGTPAPGVRVYAIPAADPSAALNAGTVFESLAQTDASGRYRLEIPVGRYYIAAGSVNSPTYYPNEAAIASAKVVTIAAGTTVDGVNFSKYVPASPTPGVPSRSTLDGILRYPDGTPAAGITILAVSISTLAASARAVTDSMGRYRIESLLPSTYYILAGYAELPTFYPGTSDIKAATTVTATAANAVPLDFTIPAAKGTPIRIRVSAAAGRPAGGSTLELTRLAPDVATPASFLPRRTYKQAMTEGDGSAEFRDVIPGKYAVAAKLAPALSLSKDVDINGQQSVDLDFSFPVNVLTGLVLWEDGSPFSDPVLNQVSLSTTSDNGVMDTTIFRISNGGIFSGVLDPGNYRVFVRNLPQGYQIQSITSGTMDLTVENVRFSNDRPLDIEIRIAKKSSSAQMVVGTIADAVTGMPPSADVVQLCCLSSGPVERMSAPLQSDGSFEFSGVPEGRYEVELRGKTPVRIIHSSIETGREGKSGLRLFSAEQFGNVRIGISLDGSDSKALGFEATVLLIPSSGETFRITMTGTADKLWSASVPLGIPYDVFVSNLPVGFKVKSLAGTDPQIGPPAVAPPANSPPGYAGMYKPFYDSSIRITLTRSD